MFSYERVYVLRLECKKFYVGSTLREMHSRYKEHAEGWGTLDRALPTRAVRGLDACAQGPVGQGGERADAVPDVVFRLGRGARGGLGVSKVQAQKLAASRDALN